ncbi:hypothetical protein [Rufibacter roseus]|uniref:YceI family protein n=1 Tax=Rufibacter roseus TaxID=1567108 RepID=A0ABW2DJF4_9BACT|nr:hypothetical protein [Rufibacter roseus]
MLLSNIVLVLLLLFPGFTTDEQYLVVRGKRISVQAMTSVGAINCSYENTRQADTLFLNRLVGKNERLVMELPVKEFGCGNPLLNRDFHRTLKAETYPEIQVAVLEMKQEGQRMKGAILVQLAGKKQVYRNVNFCRKPGQRLSATLCLLFSDFDLTMPKKFGGLVKVDEELKVTVDLLIAAGPQL